MLGRAVNLYFITKYKNISTRKPKYRRAVMRIKEFILYGVIYGTLYIYSQHSELLCYIRILLYCVLIVTGHLRIIGLLHKLS